MALILSAIVWILSGNLLQNLKCAFTQPLGLCMILFFLIHVISLFFSTNKEEAWHMVERRVSFIAIPFLLSGYRPSLKEIRGILLSFVSAVFIALSICLLIAFSNYMETKAINVFFYHALSAPLETGAVYLACFVLISIHILLFFRKTIPTYLFLIFLFAFIISMFLLNSKMMLVLLVISFVVYVLMQISNKKALLLTFALIVSMITVTVLLPQSRSRFEFELQSNTQVLSQDTFRYDTPFTGSTLRLTLWKFSQEIVKENNAMLMGVGSGDYQNLLNKKYIEKGIYTGNPQLNDTGYIGYGPHNQFVETYLYIGLLGLVTLVGIFAILILKLIKKRNYLLLQLCFIFGAFLLTESALSTQKGIVVFTLLSFIFLSINDVSLVEEKNS